MTMKIFIDGEHGTTGLQIQKRLNARNDFELISIPHAKRHDRETRLECLTAADIAILCLPDQAAIEAVNMLEMRDTRIIDSSTAHRVANDWVYGFAELTKGQKQKIQEAKYVANPGCYPTGAIALLRPLREAGLLQDNFPTSIYAISGYTGGGNQLIAQMEDKTREDAIFANYFTYGLNLHHKHVPEIKIHGQLSTTPLFVPSVGRFAQGMIVNIPLHQSLLSKSITKKELLDIYFAHYEGQDIISVATEEEYVDLIRIDAEMLANSDKMKLFVFGNEKEGIYNLCAVLDNLGKGASGAAVQNLNLMLSNA